MPMAENGRNAVCGNPFLRLQDMLVLPNARITLGLVSESFPLARRKYLSIGTDNRFGGDDARHRYNRISLGRRAADGSNVAPNDPQKRPPACCTIPAHTRRRAGSAQKNFVLRHFDHLSSMGPIRFVVGGLGSGLGRVASLLRRAAFHAPSRILAASHQQACTRTSHPTLARAQAAGEEHGGAGGVAGLCGGGSAGAVAASGPGQPGRQVRAHAPQRK